MAHNFGANRLYRALGTNHWLYATEVIDARKQKTVRRDLVRFFFRGVPGVSGV